MFGKQHTVAQTRYAQFVAEGIRAASPWLNLHGQVFLGNEQFVERMQARMEAKMREDVQIPAVQRRAPALSLTDIEAGAESRNAAIVVAYATGAYSYQQIADHFGLHFHDGGQNSQKGRVRHRF